MTRLHYPAAFQWANGERTIRLPMPSWSPYPPHRTLHLSTGRFTIAVVWTGWSNPSPVRHKKRCAKQDRLEGKPG